MIDLIVNVCMLISDSCKVGNGGCDCNAACSHDPTTNAVKCTCNTGYTNTGSGSTVVCTGEREIIEKRSDAKYFELDNRQLSSE